MTNSAGDNTAGGEPPSRGRFAIVGAVVALGLTALVVASAVLVVRGGHTPGPTSTIVFQVMPEGGNSIDGSALDATAAILQARLDARGIDESVEKSPPDRLAVHVSGVEDLASLASGIGATDMLEFILLPKATYGEIGAPGSTQTPDDGTIMDTTLPAQFTGADLDRAVVDASADENNPGSWKINFAFRGAKADEFATWTGMHVNEFFAIALDRKILSVPYIKSAVTGGSGEISGPFTEAQAKSLAANLKSGALPYPLRLVSMAGPPTSSPR